MQNGATPIHVAAQNGHRECIEVLAALGGDVNKAMSVSMQRVVPAAVEDTTTNMLPVYIVLNWC